MFDRPRNFDASSRLWRVEETPSSHSDGPAMLLRSLLSRGYQHRLSLISCVVVGLGAAAFYAHSLPPTYTSTATLLLEAGRSSVAGQELSNQQGLDTNRADSELQTIRSERLLSSVFESLRLKDSPELGVKPPNLIARVLTRLQSLLSGHLGGDANGNAIASTSATTLADKATQAAFLNFTERLHADRVGQSFVVEVEYSSSDPALPARVANAVLSGYILQAVSFKEQIARSGTEMLQGRLDSLSEQVEAARQAMSEGTLPSIPTPDADARVIGAALPPLEPSAPRKLLITLLGGFIGLLGGFSMIAFRQAFDRKIRHAGDITRESGIPCLGSLPRSAETAGIPLKVSAEDHHFVSAVHDLRTSIEIACSRFRGEKGIALAFVSWSPDADGTTLCSSLAQLMTRSRRYVTFFQNSVSPMAGAPQAFRALPTESLAGVAFASVPVENIAFREEEGISVLPVYSKDPNLNLFTDFRTPRIKKIVDALRVKGDVILDLPPLQESMDALALAAFADATVIVARTGETTLDEMADSIQLLNRSGANVIGAVLVGAPH